MDEKEKMLNGELYFPNGDDILEEQFACLEFLYDYNQTRPSEGKKREALLKKSLRSLGNTAMWSRRSVPIGEAITSTLGTMSMRILI